MENGAQIIVTQRHILSGAPGAGKTVLLRQLEQDGFGVVEEAATEIIALEQAKGIAEPWRDAAFTEKIAALQCRRLAAAAPAGTQFHDRSLVCTYALAQYLGHAVPALLETAIEEMLAGEIFMRRVFFIELLGFITPTAARRIGLEEARRFERVHEEAYLQFGFELVHIAPGSIAERAAAIRQQIGA
jgi:predicted ATPase